MSLGIAFKGPEGIVLAADSRVTLLVQHSGSTTLIPATYDNATKLLKVAGQDYVGVVTYGLGAIGQQEPRTAHSYVPEFEAELSKSGRLKVANFADKLSDFFSKVWKQHMPDPHSGDPMVFLVGGYDAGEPYGRVYEFNIPHQPAPKEWLAIGFGPVWGGQSELTGRILNGYDPPLLAEVKKFLALDDDTASKLAAHLMANVATKIPYQFLPLQDCVDLALLLVRTTAAVQSWQADVRGVGGAIDVATITRTDGFQYVQRKAVVGERARG